MILKAESHSYTQSLLWLVFGRAAFARNFIFETPDYLVDVAGGFFLLVLVGKT